MEREKSSPLPIGRIAHTRPNMSAGADGAQSVVALIGSGKRVLQWLRQSTEQYRKNLSKTAHYIRITLQSWFTALHQDSNSAAGNMICVLISNAEQRISTGSSSQGLAWKYGLRTP
jgi:hypothetical protein